MPLSTTLRKLLCCAPGRQEEEEAEMPPVRPLPEPVEAGPVQPGRPYRDYVESEAERYWREMVNVGSLTKPDLQEIRVAARPVLGLAQRYRPGWKLNPALNRAQQAVAAMQLHAWEQGWIEPPYSRLQMSPNYVEDLIQLADDAGWLAREILLPAHPAPRHPPIYYTIDPTTKRPVLTEDSLIRGDYVYDPENGSRITRDEYIRPWRDPDRTPGIETLSALGWEACYTLYYNSAHEVIIRLYWLESIGNLLVCNTQNLNYQHFSSYPPIT